MLWFCQGQSPGREQLSLADAGKLADAGRPAFVKCANRPADFVDDYPEGDIEWDADS